MTKARPVSLVLSAVLGAVIFFTTQSRAATGIYKIEIPSGKPAEITCEVSDAACEWTAIVSFINTYGDFLYDTTFWTYSRENILTYSSCHKGRTSEQDTICAPLVEPDHRTNVIVFVENPHKIGTYKPRICVDAKSKPGDAGFFLGGECLTITMNVVADKPTPTPTNKPTPTLSAKPTNTPTPTPRIKYLGPPIDVSPTATPTPTPTVQPTNPTSTPTPTLNPSDTNDDNQVAQADDNASSTTNSSNTSNDTPEVTPTQTPTTPTPSIQAGKKQAKVTPQPTASETASASGQVLGTTNQVINQTTEVRSEKSHRWSWLALGCLSIVMIVLGFIKRNVLVGWLKRVNKKVKVS